MLQILNRTRLKAALSLFLDERGAERVGVAVKGTFTMPAGARVPRLADEQVAPLYTDIYHDQPGASSVQYPVDVVPGKLGTDVLVVGTARNRRSQPVKRLETSVRVGSLTKRAVVTGDRRWEKRPYGGGFVMTEPAPLLEIPIVYERAFGGIDQTAPDGNAFAWDGRNPVGTGFRVNRDAVDGTPLPNVEDPAHLITSWNDRPPVAGFGPIDACWEPRSRFAGTYDEAWQATQAPLLPSDFDVRFFNTAPAGLVANGFLGGGEPVELVNLSEDQDIAFALPVVTVGLTLRLGSSAYQRPADLWTLILEPDQRRFLMVWGGSFALGKQPSRAHCVEVHVAGPLMKELAAGDAA